MAKLASGRQFVFVRGNKLNSESEFSKDDEFQQLIQHAQLGDPTAVGELLSRYRNYLLLIANEGVNREIQAKVAPSDLVQQTMISAQQNIGQFRGQSEDAFRAWIRQILKNDILDNERKYRKSKRRQVGRENSINDSLYGFPQLAGELRSPSSDAQLREQAVLLQQAISNLPDEYQTVIELRNWQEFSFAEIGKQMDRSEEAARKLWYRAVVKLESMILERYPGLHSTIIHIVQSTPETEDES